jgi:hypothetical protein
MEWSFQTAEELAAALRAGEVTSAELTDEAIARIERDDKVINAICVPDFDRARAAARGADQARARGEVLPLLGIPVTVKESYNMAGLPTTWGMPQHRDYVPAEDAVQVSRLKAAGAVVLGKTNVPLGLQDIQSFNEIYGTTTIRGITIARRADPPADQRRPWRPDSARCPSAPTSPVRCAPPRISAASMRTSRHSDWRQPAAWSRRRHRHCRSTSTSPSSVRWRALPATSRSCSTSWPDRTR